MTSNNKSDVFEYTGNGQAVPKDVVSLRFHSSVIEVDNNEFRDCKQLTDVVLNEGLQSIGEYAFSDCELLESINLPSTVSSIGVGVFRYCNMLKEVVLNESIDEIGFHSFYCCKTLERIIIPSTTIEIGAEAFCGCTRLKEVVIGEGLQTIGTMAFLHCKSLDSIDFPSTLRRVGYAAFQGCTSLPQITLPPSLVEIGSSAFRACTKLKKVNINNMFKLIVVFNECSSLQRYNFEIISMRLENILPAGSRSQMGIMCKIDAIRDPLLQRNGSKLFASATAANAKKGCEKIKGCLDKIDRLITNYETIIEGTTLFELALWKAKMEQVDHHINRDAYRIDVPGPVKDAVMQYLKTW